MHDISVLPILVHAGERVFRDGHPTASAVYRAIADGENPKTSPVSAAAYLQALIGRSDEPALIVTPATEFTVMHRNASLAASLAKAPVEVVDSRTAAAAQGLVVLEAAVAAAEGAALDEAAEVARDAVGRVHLLATADAFHVLRASGRVPPGMLEFERGEDRAIALFELARGSVRRLGVAGSVDESIDMLTDAWAAGGGRFAARAVAFHAATPEHVAELVGRLSKVDEVVEFTAALGVHTGPGVLGISWLDPR